MVPVVERNLLVFSETFGAFVLPHCVDPVPDHNKRDRESDLVQLIATLDRLELKIALKSELIQISSKQWGMELLRFRNSVLQLQPL